MITKCYHDLIMNRGEEVSDVSRELRSHDVNVIRVMMKFGSKGIICLYDLPEDLVSIPAKLEQKKKLTSAAASKNETLSSGNFRSSSISWGPLTTTNHRSTRGTLKMPPLYYINMRFGVNWG